MNKFVLFILLFIGTHASPNIFGMKNSTKKCNLCWINDEKVESLPCHQEHTFHVECLRDWIASHPTKQYCFFCNTSLPKKIEDGLNFKQTLLYCKNILFENNNDNQFNFEYPSIYLILKILGILYITRAK